MAFPGFLRKIDIFRNIGPTELRELLKVLQVRSYPADAPIFSKGDKAQHMFILLSGRVKIYSRSTSKMRATFAFLDPGEFFGEMALISSQPRSMSAQAVEDSKALLLHKKDFHRLLRDNAPFCGNILRNMSFRLTRADEQIENLRFHNILGRVSKVLWHLARKHGKKRKDGVLVAGDYSRQELADMVGTTREPFSRALASLQRAQMLRLRKDGILLFDLKKIKALAGANGG